MRTISEAIADPDWTRANRAEFLLVFACQMAKKTTGGDYWVIRRGGKAIIRWKTLRGFVEPFAAFEPKDALEALMRGGRGFAQVIADADDLRQLICR